jgi:hypothetical protein
MATGASSNKRHWFRPRRKVIDEAVAGPTRFGELIPALAMFGVWLAFLLPQGARVAGESAWLPLIGALLAGWTLLIRIRYSADSVAMTIGPWRRQAALNSLESVTWRRTGAGRSRGTIYVLDRSGHRVPIYVGRFTKRAEWGPLILSAADSCRAQVDQHSRAYLDGRMAESALVH